MIRLGVTGGIGSGKTYVCQLLEQHGIPVYYADAAARHLQDTDPALRATLIDAFGPETYTATGLDRPYLAHRVFGNPDALARLNAIVHPAVFADGENWFAQQAQAGAWLAAYEAAILFEIGRYKSFDAMLLVTAPEAVRIQRVVARDGITEAEVRARIARQWPDAQKISLADFVVVNDGQQDVASQIETVVTVLRQRIS